MYHPWGALGGGHDSRSKAKEGVTALRGGQLIKKSSRIPRREKAAFNQGEGIGEGLMRAKIESLKGGVGKRKREEERGHLINRQGEGTQQDAGGGPIWQRR